MKGWIVLSPFFCSGFHVIFSIFCSPSFCFAISLIISFICSCVRGSWDFIYLSFIDLFIYLFFTSNIYPNSNSSYTLFGTLSYDGTTKKLGIIAVQNHNTLKDIEIKPNPIQDKAYLSIPSLKDDNITITIKDISGKTIDIKETNLKTGDNYFELQMESLEKGVYFVEISNRYTSKVFKLYKN